MFVKVETVRKKHRSKRANPKSLAHEALDYIGNLYRIEKEARRRELDAAHIYQLRQKKSKPLLDEFKDWLEANKPLTPPKGLLGQAISYTLANWQKLIIYIQDGRLRPDNNLVENAIRPFVVGRKNFYSGWCQFIRAAKAMKATLWIYARQQGQPGLDFDIFLYRKKPEPGMQDRAVVGQISEAANLSETGDKAVEIALLPVGEIHLHSHLLAKQVIQRNAVVLAEQVDGKFT